MIGPAQVMSENALTGSQRQLEPRGQFGLCKMYRQDRCVTILREVDFVTTMTGSHRVGCHKDQKSIGSANRAAEFFTPLLARGNAFVVPDMDTLLTQPLDFRVHNFIVLVCIAHKNIGFITRICGEGLFHVVLNKRTSSVAVIGEALEEVTMCIDTRLQLHLYPVTDGL